MTKYFLEETLQYWKQYNIWSRCHWFPIASMPFGDTELQVDKARKWRENSNAVQRFHPPDIHTQDECLA